MQFQVPAEKHIKAKVCLVGEVAVGKTSLVKRFVLDTFDDRYVATVGTKVTKKTVPVMWRGAPAKMDIMVWDIMGEKGFRALLKEAYFEGCQGVLAVADLTRKDTLYDLNNWIALTKKQVGNVPVVFLGNKMDLRDRIAVPEADLARLGGIHTAPTMLTSAKTGDNVERAFRTVAEAIAGRHNGDG
jgi:small GTP-binding protein